jgi:arabinose-5-phosphate isomerase
MWLNFLAVEQGAPNASCGVGAAAIRLEASGLLRLADSLSADFGRSIELILAGSGRVVVTGMGKSGHVGRKIAATLASTGTPAMFLHPAEASHGDLGMVSRNDIVLAISKSGESPELSDVISYCRRHAMVLIAITAVPSSSLGRMANAVLLLPDVAEACPLGLAPTTSTTMAMAMGDAIAVACLQRRDFRAADFREFHPGGKLGLRLKRVKDIMYKGADLPLVTLGQTVSAAILEMTRTRLGCVGVVDFQGLLTGIFTDGDLRRCISSAITTQTIEEVMSTRPYQISSDALVEEVALLFTTHRIPSVFVTCEHKPVGVVHVHDLLRSGLI